MTNFIRNVRLVLNTFIPQRKKPDHHHKIPESDKAISGKVVVFTGGTDGMGRVAIEMLYSMGAHIILPGRNKAKGEKVIQEITTSGGLGTIEFLSCDLSILESVCSCADHILTKYDKIDILINCAGGNYSRRVVTSEGFDSCWTSNYLGPFLLTKLLLERIKNAESGRIVNLSSATEALGHINFDDIQMEKGWNALKSYAQAKLAMNMFTINLAQALKGTGVTVNSLNPGFIKSNLLRNLKGFEGFFRIIMKFFASPPEVGADRIVRLAISSEYEGVSGVYVSEDTITLPNPEAQDVNLRKKLMEISESSVNKWLETV
ncbi:MAG: SDR family oxidoreductase [Endozoicomonadaceae bacterium]|nr:SDR family oxidoreductase [Endozoicomonadaceae bacterium]MCY4330883.1 SDR family oxidoreductase [Endozoicomonadaceae bacterium]